MVNDLENMREIEQHLCHVSSDLLDLIKHAQQKHVFVDNLMDGTDLISKSLFDLRAMIERTNV